MKKEDSSFMPKIFHPSEHSLSGLATIVATTIDSHIQRIDMSDSDYQLVIRLGKILYKSAESEYNSEWTPVKDDPELACFVADVLKAYTGNPISTSEDLVSQTRMTALDLLKLKELPEKRQEELRNFCLELAIQARSYWHQQNPFGFKHYCA